MNTACSCCLETFASSSDISTTPCGHVFHTECITRWLGNRQHNNCAQCRKKCNPNQIIKLYFSEADSENSLVDELQSENLRLQGENLQLQNEVNVSKSNVIEVQREKLKLQKTLIDTKKNFGIIEKNFKMEREMSEIAKKSNMTLVTEIYKNVKGMYDRLSLIIHPKIYHFY